MTGDCPVDIVFVMDGSGSLNAAAQNALSQFVEDVITGLPTSSSQARIGLITFSDDADSCLDLGENADDQGAILLALDICSPLLSFTNTAAGLKLMRDMFDDFGRNGVKKVAVVMTDGLANRPSGTAEADLITQANGAQTDGITVVSVGRSADNK